MEIEFNLAIIIKKCHSTLCFITLHFYQLKYCWDAAAIFCKLSKLYEKPERYIRIYIAKKSNTQVIRNISRNTLYLLTAFWIEGRERQK